jgi:hypothetical protein
MLACPVLRKHRVNVSNGYHQIPDTGKIKDFSSSFDFGEADKTKNLAQLGGVGEGVFLSADRSFVYKEPISRICWNDMLNSLDSLDSLNSFILVQKTAI